MVNNAIHTLNTHFVKPFDPSLDSDNCIMLFLVLQYAPEYQTVCLILRKMENYLNLNLILEWFIFKPFRSVNEGGCVYAF